MKILVYGKGWIGNQFMDILTSNNIDFVCGESRVDNINTLLEEMNRINPTHVISFIGRTHGVINGKIYPTIDYLEQGKLFENIRDNLFGPLILAKICQDKKIHCTYLGTGCIFKYDEEHPNGFTEDSLPNFFGSSYSIVKGFTDQFINMFDALNLRIRMPITGEKNPRNFITKITNYEKICSIPNSMSVLPELLPMVLEMMKQQLKGTINLTNPGVISHNEILEMYREIVDPYFQWKNFSQEEQRQILAADRSNNLLNTEKLESLFPVLPIKESIRKILYDYKESAKINILITGGCGLSLIHI